MNSCPGRQLHAVPGRLRAQALSRAPLGVHTAARPVLRRWAAANGNAQSQPAISLGSEASAVQEPGMSTNGQLGPSAVSSAAAAVAGVDAAAAVAAAADAEQPQEKKKSSNFVNRVIFGIILGFGGAAVVFAGNMPYLGAALFVVYQATQEFFGMLTSKGISQGTPPPPPFVSVATTALCLSVTAFTYFTHGRSGAAMSVAAFLLLVMNILVNRKPTFAQLTASVFGLFYCGKC